MGQLEAILDVDVVQYFGFLQQCNASGLLLVADLKALKLGLQIRLQSEFFQPDGFNFRLLLSHFPFVKSHFH
jgi:hypothetical protein